MDEMAKKKRLLTDREYVASKYMARIEACEEILDTLSFTQARDEKLLKRIKVDLQQLAVRIVNRIEVEIPYR
jgi:hypothetical protein